MAERNWLLTLAATRLAESSPLMRRVVQSIVDEYHRKLGVEPPEAPRRTEGDQSA